MEKRFYGKKEEARVASLLRKYLIVFFTILLVGLGITLLVYFLTNRANYIFTEVFLCVFFFVYLSSLLFVGFYFLMPLIGRRAFLKSLRNVPLKKEELTSFEPSAYSLYAHELEFAELSVTNGEAKKIFLVERTKLDELKGAKRILLCIDVVVGVSDE